MLFPLLLTVATGVADVEGDALGYSLEIRDVRRVEAILTYHVHCPHVRAQEWIGFVAQASELAGQANVKTLTEPKGSLLKESSPLHRSVIRICLPLTTMEETTDFPIQVVYRATLRSRHLRPGREGETLTPDHELTDGERKACLMSLGQVNHSDPGFRSWMRAEDLMRGPSERVIEFAKRVFVQIRSTFAYQYEPGQDRHASAVCRAKWSDCGGLSVLLVSVLRANGIPARTLYGRWAQSAQPGGRLGSAPYYQWHVKAEFFAPGVGWIPVDMAAGIERDKSRAGLRFFGHDEGDFLVLHVDPDLDLQTARFGMRRAGNLQTPAYWVFGEGRIQPSEIHESWKVYSIPDTARSSPPRRRWS
jgi:transglutaminase-like putative cysteine protease